MNLFDKIPENYFSILVSKNKKIYIDALFELRNAFKQEMFISKDNLIIRLINTLDDEIIDADFTEDDEDKELSDINSSAKAYFLLRKLKKTGWIEMEMQRDSFEEMVILPDYTIKFLDFLYDIVNEKRQEFNSYVFGTYSSLKIAKVEPDKTYEAIVTAYNNSIELMNELKSLYNNLGRYHKKINFKTNINDIIKEHFNDYKEYSDNMIYPLITRDSIPRYKFPIKEMLNEILVNEELLKETVNKEIARKRYKDLDEAEKDILNKIRAVIEIYQNIDVVMNQIETRNNEYIRASMKRIQYLLTSDKELKGKLIALLKNSKNDIVVEEMENEIKLLKQEYLSESSISIRNTVEKRKKGEAIDIKNQEENSMESLKVFAESLSSLYSSRQIDEFVEKSLNNKPYINSSEISIKTVEDLVLLILATIKVDKTNKSFYYIEDSNQMVINGEYKIPNIKFIRK